jgi:hypothetical protein
MTENNKTEPHTKVDENIELDNRRWFYIQPTDPFWNDVLPPHLEGNTIFNYKEMGWILVGFSQNTYNDFSDELRRDRQRALPERIILGEEDWLRSLNFLNEHTDNISTPERPINDIYTFTDWIMGDSELEEFLPYMGAILATQEHKELDQVMKSLWSQRDEDVTPINPI